MRAIQGPPQHQHVAQGALWVEEVDLLQYHHYVPDMNIPEVYSHGGLRHRLDTTPLNWSVPQPRPCREHHPLSPGIIAPALPFLLMYCKSLCHAVLGLTVLSQ